MADGVDVDGELRERLRNAAAMALMAKYDQTHDTSGMELKDFYPDADAVLDALGLEQVEGWRFGVSPSRLTVDPSPHRREDECGRRGCTPVYRLASPSLTGVRSEQDEPNRTTPKEGT